MIEAKKFLQACIGGTAENPNIHDAVASARVIRATDTSVESGVRVTIPEMTGSTAAIRETASVAR
ncbi:hypothetical protein [Cryobacterium psychrophilum]|uniref:Uncharacterized protein n=1 Tax=Cryobacterium psychrophilum TaxID=41988 RepID=A0A4Y8KVC1_9MICO|nr:hypothetical protein [Cryobacterium psychrophilum]TFD81436.1 hypothetical protein E3T53_02960 [Cryobacterium psychrophilum]